MKSFFKKLASVLALAMVVSLAAPAAQTVKAADAKEFTYKYQTGIGAAVKTVNLAKTGDTVDLKFIGISDYKNYELIWMGVGTGFTVDQKTGEVTATADEGSGVVWLSVGDDQTYVSDPIKVTIGELKATIGTQDKSNKDLGTLELKVGEKEDLAFYGITDWNLGKYGYKWVIGDTSILDVDQKTGEITALKAGTTTVTFMAPNKFNQSNVTVTAPLTVTVKPLETTFEVTNKGFNTTQNEVIVEFSEKYEPKNVELYRVFVADDSYNFNGKVDENLHEDAYESVYINNTYAIDDTNKFSINPYVDFEDGAIYEIRIDNLKKVWFKASVGAVAKVVVVEDVRGSLEEDIELAIPSKFSVELYDKNNVKVNGAKVNGIANDSPEYITFSLVESGEFDLDVDELTFYDYVPAKIYATYESPAVKDPVKSAEFTARPNRKSAYGVEEIIAWTVVWDREDSINWNKTNHWFSASDDDVKLAVLFKDTRGEYYTTDERGAGWKYNGNYVNYTGIDGTMHNGEGTTFADYGYYVEFKAMNPDNLLIDVDGQIRAYKKTSARWALYLYNYNNQESQFEKEIFSAVLSVDAEREMKKIDANNNEFDLMYYTEEEYSSAPGVNRPVANAYYSDFSTKDLVLDCFDQFGWSWAGATEFVITSVTKGIPAFEDLLDTYEATLNGANNNTNHNGNDTRDAWITIELVDYLKTPGNYADGLFGGRTSFSFIVKEVNSGSSEKITVNFKTPTDYIVNVAGTRVPQGFAVVAESPLTTTESEEKFDLSTGNVVNVTYATNDTNGNASKTITLYHKDTKGYTIGYENDLLLGVKAPTYDNTLKKYVLNVADLMDDTNNAATITDANIGTKVLIVTDPSGKALQLATVGNANAALTATEKRLYANQSTCLAPATGSALGLSINTRSTWSKDASGLVTNTSNKYFGFDFMHKEASNHGGDEITYLAAGNYKATVYTIEKVEFAADNVTPVRVVFSGNSLFKQTTTFKVTNNLPQIQFAKRLNATTTDDLTDVDPLVHDDEHVKELIAENFQFSLDGATYYNHNLGANKITADDIVAYTVRVSSNNQIVIQNVTFKVYVDWNNNGDIGDEDIWYRSTCTVNQSLTYREER